MIKLDEFKRIDLRIGQVDKVEGNIIHIKCNAEFKIKTDLKLSEGEKILVLLNEGKLYIPLVENEIISPDKPIEEGSKIR